MQRTLLMQRALLRRRLVAMRSSSTERISLDGSLHLSTAAVPRAVPPTPTTTTTTAPTPSPTPPRRRPAIIPDAQPLSNADLERLVDFVVSCPRPRSPGNNNKTTAAATAATPAGTGATGGLVCITGAGISTEAKLPDYRGPGGAYSTGFKPMTHQQFLASPDNRRRYWARAFAGWEGFASAVPAAPHVALARLQARGWVGEIVTQNVDRLHTRAGAKQVLELHGTTHEVVCLACGQVSPRAPLQRQMEALNPHAAAAAAARRRQSQQEQAPSPSSPYVSAPTPLQRRPDGDAELDAAEMTAPRFVVPPCPSCGAGGGPHPPHHPHHEVALKPHVVFFGDGVPQDRADRALSLASRAGALLVVGSSLRVWSAFRLVRAAAERGVPIAVLNAGATRADEQLPAGSVTLRLDCLAGEALSRLERHAATQLPASSAAW
jgi:NAD+-dependent protein deacetylase sirtuin 4